MTIQGAFLRGGSILQNANKMERVTKIRLKKASGKTAMFLQFRGWYVEIGDSKVYHFPHKLRTDANFDNAPENEYFDAGKVFQEEDAEHFRNEVLESEAFLKDSCGSLSRAFRLYLNPNEA